MDLIHRAQCDGLRRVVDLKVNSNEEFSNEMCLTCTKILKLVNEVGVEGRLVCFPVIREAFQVSEATQLQKNDHKPAPAASQRPSADTRTHAQHTHARQDELRCSESRCSRSCGVCCAPVLGVFCSACVLRSVSSLCLSLSLSLSCLCLRLSLLSLAHFSLASPVLSFVPSPLSLSLSLFLSPFCCRPCWEEVCIFRCCFHAQGTILDLTLPWAKGRRMTSVMLVLAIVLLLWWLSPQAGD